MTSPATNLGFDSTEEADLFRAIANVHPKAVLINEKDWQRRAETLTKRGYLQCVIGNEGPTYRLTKDGVRHAVGEKLISRG
jgi:hypothetical protein